MCKQLEFNFDGFATKIFEQIKEHDTLNYIVMLENKLKQAGYKIRTFKGHTTKRKKK